MSGLLLEDSILEGLDDEQRTVASSLTGPLCVLAGAGTGKTRAITHRIAYGVQTGFYKPQQVLAVTFTARAAAEMRTRLRDLGAVGVQARTFHAAALRQLQYFWPQAVGGPLPALVDHKAQLIAEAARRLRLSTDRAAIRDVAAEIEWAKVSMLTPDAYAAAAAGRAEPAGMDLITVSRIFSAYEDLKIDRNLIDFEDVLLTTVAILEDDEKVAATVRSQYRHFVVDEYQDVSPLQQRLLDLWLGERRELCVVGDASQTIYSFTGATSRHLLDFTARYEGAQVVKLVRDYRSTPQVVRAANTLLTARGNDADRRGTATTWSAPLELIAQRPPGPEPAFTECSDDDAEGTECARRIGVLLSQGVKASEIAILYRTNGQSAAYEQALATAGIGYQLRGGERFFQRREVRDALLQLRAAARAQGDDDVPQQVRDVLASLGYTSVAPQNSGAVRERWESLAALVGLADELNKVRGPEVFTLQMLVAELEERAAAQHAPTVQGVTLASLHSAKGLEWDAVFLVGLSEGLMPISFADTQEAIDEERRLLYVGITRARIHLQMSWSTSRSPGGRASRKPSRFLDALRPATAGQASFRPPRAKANRKSSAPATCRVCKRPLLTGSERKIGRCNDCPVGYEERTFEALRAWRLSEARDKDVPAFVVFTDATLVAIAEARPQTLEELGDLAGVGSAKLERYGEAILEIIRDTS